MTHAYGKCLPAKFNLHQRKGCPIYDKAALFKNKSL